MLTSLKRESNPRRTRVATAYGWSAVVALGMSVCAGLSAATAGGTHSHDGILLWVLTLWVLAPLAALLGLSALWLRRIPTGVGRVLALALPALYIVGVLVLSWLVDA
jgi:hypothetical protein